MARPALPEKTHFLIAPGRWALVRTILAACAGAILLTSCATRQQFGVPTSSARIAGTCDASRVAQLGVSLDLSGGQGELGHEYLTGMEIAAQQVNQTGGILGDHDCLQLLYKDDEGNPQIGERAVLDLVNDEQVDFLVGPFLSTQVATADVTLHGISVPTVTFSQTDEIFNAQRYPEVFPMTTSIADQARTMAAFAANRNWSRVGLLSVQDPAGRQGASAFTVAAHHHHLVLSGQESYRPGGAGAEAALEALRKTRPAVVAVVDDTPSVGSVLRLRSMLGWRVPVVAGPLATDASALAVAGTAGLRGVSTVVPTGAVVRPGLPSGSIRAFRNVVLHRLGQSALEGSVVAFAQGYDAVRMFANAANESGQTDAGDVRSYLESSTYQGLLASYTYSSSAHTGIPASQTTVVPATSLSNGLFSSS
jgi:branched-chain amino acid transport system substrate-binding protein